MTLITRLYHPRYKNLGVFTPRMRIAHTACVMFSQFLSFLLFTGGGGGVQESAPWAHCCYKSAHAHGGGAVQESTPSAHCCYKNVYALGGWGGVGVRESALWAIVATSARYAIVIRIAFLFSICFTFNGSGNLAQIQKWWFLSHLPKWTSSCDFRSEKKTKLRALLLSPQKSYFLANFTVHPYLKVILSESPLSLLRSGIPATFCKSVILNYRKKNSPKLPVINVKTLTTTRGHYNQSTSWICLWIQPWREDSTSWQSPRF